MLPAERLLQLREALLFGDPIDAEARLDLLALLERERDRAEPRRGRPRDDALHMQAGIVGTLQEKHGVPLKAALFAAAPNATERERQSIERTYRALRAGGTIVRVPAVAVREALATLGHRRRKGG